MALIAKTAILWRGRMYEAGQELPAAPADMVKAWLECGSAEDTAAATPAAEQIDETDLNVKDQEQMLTGHRDLEQLKTMKKPELEALAKEMGVELQPGDTKEKITEKLAAVPVQVPADESTEEPEE